MPAATHWRVRIQSSVGGTWIVFTEVAFLDTQGNDLSVGGTAIASSQYSAAFAASKAFDKVLNSGSRWCNVDNQFPAWIGYAHPAAVDVAFVRIWCDSLFGIGSAQCPPNTSAVSLEYSVDSGATWIGAGVSVRHEGAWVESGVVLLSAAASIAAPRLSAAEVAASAPVSVHEFPSGLGVDSARDIEFGGSGLIWGTTKTEVSPDVNVPTKARVVLLHQRSNLPVRTTWSNATTGVFEFAGIDTTQQFIALAEDALGNYRPVAANKVTPEAAL